MITARKLILSGTVLTLAATGFAVAQDRTPATEAPAAIEERAPTGEVDAAPAGDAERATTRAERRSRTISEEEFGSRRLERLAAADTDGDGELSRAEIEELALRQIVERRADRMERRLDIDGDGTVTLAEMEAHQDRRFAYLDRNADGELDRREMRRGENRMGWRERGHHHRRHGMGEERGGPRN